MAVGTKTPLFVRKQSGGVFTVVDERVTTGDIWWVDSGSATGADSAGYGRNPDAPFLTIDYAVGQCTASNGDIIYVMPGHAETLAAAAAIDLDVAGISVIGLGSGATRPTLTFSDAASDIDVDADDITIENLVFVVSVDSVVAMIDVNADDFTIKDCEWQEASALQWISAIDVDGGAANACDRFAMYGCKIVQVAAGADQAVDIARVHDGIEIVGNFIDGDFVNAALYSPAIFTNALVKDNVLANRQAGDHAIEFTAACTGLLVDNRLYGSTFGTILDPGSLMCLGNLEVDAVDQAGVSTPATAGGAFPAGSIAAATFAAGAIDAAAIANDAIDATAIANAAIDAATFAAGAIDATAIAADAITNAKIADNAFASEQFALSAGEKTTDGVVVTRATAALPQTAAAAIFTVTGIVLLKRIVGYVTTQIGAVANATKLVGNSTGAGASTDLCGTLDINGHVVDSRYEITGTFINAMVRVLDIPAAPTQATDVVIPPGTIDVNCAGSDGGTGRVRWSVTYVPLESGAQVVAA